jgi:hypothetical protein
MYLNIIIIIYFTYINDGTGNANFYEKLKQLEESSE